MENRKTVISYALIGILTILFGFYSSTANYANAISVVSVTFPATTTTLDVSYAGGIFSSNTDSTAYVIGAFGGVAHVWKKSGSGLTENTIISNVTLTGSGSARAIEVHTGLNAIYAVTNDKFYKLTSLPAIALQRAEGIANNVRQLHYDDFSNTLYFCTNDVYGTLNAVTLAPTTLYTDPQLNTLLDCAFDVENGFAYLTGIDIGTGFNADIIKIDLDTHTQVDSNAVTNFLFGVCADIEGQAVWATESSAARVYKYDMATLTQQTFLTTGTTPRFCSIADGDQARRLYVANEGTDNVSIVDIDANVVISTQLTCNQGLTTPRIDTKRLFNTTNTYIPCPEATNSVIIDDTVSEEIPEADPDSCDNPDNADLLRCRLGEDGGIGGIGNSVGEGVTLLACNVIFVDCTDENPQTNGIGLLVFIASIFVIVGMFYWAIGTNAFHMPIFIWIVIIVALSAFFTITGWIDPVFLVISVIAIVALASPKIISVIRGSTFGRGSTE